MSTSTRVLLLENEPHRVAWFQANGTACEITHVTTVPEAITRLESEPFDQLWLDHDLGTEPAAGRDVATWLIAHPECQPGLRIVTHTVNAVSGPKIRSELRAAGRSCMWVPFHETTAVRV